jgi:hypothetical protein
MKSPEEMVAENINVRELVENYWGAFLRVGTQDLAEAKELTSTFERRTEEIAAGLGGEYGHALRVLVARERERLLREYEADPAAFRRRLGVAPVE